MSDSLGDDRPGRATIRDFTVQLLLDGVSLVNGEVYVARVWPVTPESLPMVAVYMQEERKSLLSIAGGAPDFSVVATLIVQAWAEDATAAAVEGWLDLLAGQIETTLLNNAEWVAMFEKVLSVTTTSKVDPGGDRPVGQIALAFELQWDERFPPFIPDVLQTVRMRFVPLPLRSEAIDEVLSIAANVTLPTPGAEPDPPSALERVRETLRAWWHSILP
jgi:hypothetical protein